VRTLNLGILAHVDAGKTSLTERLLYAAGVIDHVGRVDDGNTVTDTLALERQRGITIKSAVTAFDIGTGDGAVAVNLIDTPGHPDFIAEVERVLDVLDGVVLVVSAVEGVQAQTRILMRALRRLGIPVLIFVNKIDRAGARPAELPSVIADRLRIKVLPMGAVEQAGTRDARCLSYDDHDAAFRAMLIDSLTEHDDALLADYLAERELSAGRLRRALTEQSRRSLVHPLFFGSAMTGVGIKEIMAGIGDLLPAGIADRSRESSAVVFKIDRGSGGEKISYVRCFGGELRTRDVVPVRSPDGRDRGESKITGIRVFVRGKERQTDRLADRQIGKLWGVADARIGDVIGTGAGRTLDHYFTPPTLETVIHPVNGADRGRLRVALDQLAEQDPLINVRADDVRGEVSVSLYGEVQKQVIEATLAGDFGVPVTFSETSTIHVERPLRTGAAVELIKAEDNPFLATIGLRVEPGEPGSGVRYGMEKTVHGTMPPAFFTAIEETVYDCTSQALHGWQLIDAVITLTHTGYYPRQSHAHQGFSKAMSSTGSDFRDLTPLVLMAALERAGTAVLEPIHRFTLEAPEDILGPLYPVLAAHRAVPDTPVIKESVVIVEGDLPAAEVHALEQQIPGLTHGEGVLDYRFDRYEPVTGVPPQRSRTDRNPLNRREYLLRTTRGKGALV
jgi:ribosomal protection tetracycline resistance protein